MAAQVGALRVTLGANTAQYQAGMTRAQIQARRTGQTITSEMQRAKVATTSAFLTMRNAAAAFGIGIATAGVAGLVSAGRAALEYASNLGETAQQIGVTVEQLQILSRMAIENGASQETMERSLAKLNLTLGDAKTGTKAALEAFTSLGFTNQQIGSFAQGGDALREVAERIMAIPDPARQAAAAQNLFGRSGQELMPLLANIARGYDEAAAKARQMGLLTAEQAARADDAKDAMDAFAHSLQTRLAIAIADNLGPINDVISGLEQLIGVASRAIGWLDSLRVGLNNAQNTTRGLMNRAADLMVPGHAVMRRAGEQQARNTPTRGFVGGFLQSLIPTAPTARPSSTVNIPTAGGRGSRGGRGGAGDAERVAREAERARQDALREEHQFQSDMRRHRMELLRIQQGMVDDYQLRYDVGRDIAAAEREQYVADQRLAVQLGELSQVRADQLIAEYDATALAQLRADDLEVAAASAHEIAELSEARFDVESDALRNEASLAETASERRAAELRLLELTHRHERAKLQAIIADETAERATRERARIELEGLDARTAGEADQIRAGTRGPLEEYLSTLPDTAAKANEALEAVAANGLQSITDGLADAIMMTRSWGDVFKNIAKQILADLIKIQIQRVMANVLGNVAGGIGGGIGGGKGGGLSFGGGKARGGAVVPGKYYTVGEKGPERFVPFQRGVILPNNDNGPSRVQIVPSPYFDVVVDSRAVQVAAPIGQAAETRGRVGARMDMVRAGRRQFR